MSEASEAAKQRASLRRAAQNFGERCLQYARHGESDDFIAFEQVLREEHEAIAHRRRVSNVSSQEELPLAGLALSGGGIRSATFSLGVLQALSREGLIERFDYLSTVSGGGYAGGWWSAWLARGRRPPQSAGTPKLFPDEKIEPRRWSSYLRATANQPDGSRSAQEGDPLHHLRLHANYLTPRKGLLSADTWRAATIIIRNLLLTWSVLLPCVLVCVLAGLAFFAAPSHAAATFGVDGTREANALLRLQYAARPITMLVIWSAWLSLMWMLTSAGYWLPSAVGVLAVCGMSYSLNQAFFDRAPNTFLSEFWSSLWGDATVFGLTGFTLFFVGALVREGITADLGKRAERRSRIARWQAYLLVATAALTLLLGVAGFSRDLMWLLLDRTSEHSVYAKTGVGAAIVSLGSAAFTVLKGLPTAGADARDKKQPSLVSQLVFALAPPLTLLLIAIVVAAGAHELIAQAGTRYEAGGAEALSGLVHATWAGIALQLFFAAHETFRDELELARIKRVLIVTVPTSMAALSFWYWSPHDQIDETLTIAAFMVAFVALCSRFARFRWQWLSWKVVVPVIAGVAFLAPSACRHFNIACSLNDGTRWLIAVAIACAAFALSEIAWLNSQRWRAATLVALAFVGLVSLLIPHLVSAQSGDLAPPAPPYGAVTFSLIVVSISMVIGLGWLADPNQLSIHSFYRSRLVRAYLGASNTRRVNSEISETHEDDDFCLSRLDGYLKGGPYHLINTTLNLVGGRDLSTTQRSADLFVLSQKYCGSARTGYRKTSGYMHGAMSLGTAIAISGAAVSPNMGSKTPPAALAMLLTLFNVRLGYWAPTPREARWRSPQARLWPFYLLRESLSQTNALGTYCYLTDGGHFDNTGIYSLVARGCRVIVVADNGADPALCFEDMGNAIRRCRSDFGTEITLSLDAFLPDDKNHASDHIVVGELLYSQDHAQILGWREGAEARRGIIVWIKPALTGREAIDVRQYGRENHEFPQQTTVDQWFDEAQFESYRRLGFESAANLTKHEVAMKWLSC